MSSCLRNVLGVSVVLAVACGGSASNSAVGGGDGGGSIGDSSLASSGSSSGSGSGGGATSDDSGLTEVDDSGYIVIPGGDDDGGDDDASSSSSSGASSGSSGSSSGTIEAGIGVTTPPHGTDGGAMQIECGATPCDSTTQVCCASALGRMCTTAAACDGDVLACSGTNSCATGVCCEIVADAGRAIRTRCEAACPAGVPQLCTTNADCTKVDQYCHKYGSYGVCERALAATRDQ
jgi:hypothetical protein